jgi:hypothetical protein
LIFGLVAITSGLAVAALGGTVAMIAVTLRVLRCIDHAVGPHEADAGGGDGEARLPQPPDLGAEPAWWPDFERQLADYIARDARDR